MRKIIKLLVSEYCGMCKKILKSQEEYLCPFCLQQVEGLIQLISLKRADISEFPKNSYSLIDYHQMKNYWDILKDIKFNNKKAYLHLLLNYLPNMKFIECSAVTYVPISFKRFLERGFNPSFVVASQIGKNLNIPCLSLLKKKDTLKQSDKTKLNRLSILENPPFILKNTKIPQGKILLVDDIITTGSSVASISGLIQKRYKTEVVVFSLFHSELL